MPNSPNHDLSNSTSETVSSGTAMHFAVETVTARPAFQLHMLTCSVPRK